MSTSKLVGSNELGFVALQNPSRWGEKKGSFVASVHYRERVNLDSLAAVIAKRSNRHIADVNAILNHLCSAVADEVAMGNFVDLGIVQIGLSISGTLKTINAPFDPAVNKVNVKAAPTRRLSAVAKSLKPVNVTAFEKPIVHEVCPDGGEPNTVIANVRIIVNLERAKIDLDAADEGIWLETLDGEKVHRAEVTYSDPAVAYFRFNEPIAPGKYRLAIYCRNGDPAAGISAVRRIVTVR